MLDSLKPLALQFELNGRLLNNAIGDMPEALWLRRLGGSSNHVAFLALHLLDARCFILRLLGTPVTHGFEDVGKDATRLEDIGEYPSPPEILESWNRVSEGLLSSLGEVDPERLNDQAPHHFPVNDPSVLGAISFLAQHEGYHIGQLGIIRRIVGLGALSYS